MHGAQVQPRCDQHLPTLKRCPVAAIPPQKKRMASRAWTHEPNQLTLGASLGCIQHVSVPLHEGLVANPSPPQVVYACRVIESTVGIQHHLVVSASFCHHHPSCDYVA